MADNWIAKPYWLSWWEPQTTTSIRRRPWWNFWGRDSLVVATTLRFRHVGLSQRPDQSALDLLAPLLVPGIQYVSLESNQQVSPYISTTTFDD